jgi:hypothetical protein
MAFETYFSPLGVMVVFSALVLVLFLWLCNPFGDYFTVMKKSTVSFQKKKKKFKGIIHLKDNS